MILRQNRPKLLTVKEAVQILHIHENTLRRWADKGILTTVRIGPRGDRRFLEDNLNEIKSHMGKNHGNKIL